MRKQINIIAFPKIPTHIFFYLFQVYAWGQNDKGQLGLGCTEAYSATPIFVTFPASLFPTKSVACGPDSTLALSAEGKLCFFGHCNYTPDMADRKGLVFQICTDLDPTDPIVDFGTKHWATLYACQTESGKVYLWGKVRGGKKRSLYEETRASTVNDVFSMFSNPPGMIRPLTLSE